MELKNKIIIAVLILLNVLCFIPAERAGFSIGDLILNTIAGLIGWGIAVEILYHLIKFIRRKLHKPVNKIFSFELALIIYLVVRLVMR